MGAFTNLWNSEKGLAGGVLIIAATLLVALGHLPGDVWVEYTKWIFGIFVAGKTVQGAVSAMADRPAAPTGVVSGEIQAKDAAKEPS